MRAGVQIGQTYRWIGEFPSHKPDLKVTSIDSGLAVCVRKGDGMRVLLPDDERYVLIEKRRSPLTAQNPTIKT